MRSCVGDNGQGGLRARSRMLISTKVAAQERPAHLLQQALAQQQLLSLVFYLLPPHFLPCLPCQRKNNTITSGDMAAGRQPEGRAGGGQRQERCAHAGCVGALCVAGGAGWRLQVGSSVGTPLLLCCRALQPGSPCRARELLDLRTAFPLPCCPCSCGVSQPGPTLIAAPLSPPSHAEVPKGAEPRPRMQQIPVK